MNVNYESVAATGAGATGRGKIEKFKFIAQYLKANMELALKRTGLIHWGESIELEDMTKVNKELDKLLSEAGTPPANKCYKWKPI